jgi:hypothetical protein
MGFTNEEFYSYSHQQQSLTVPSNQLTANQNDRKCSGGIGLIVTHESTYARLDL